MTMSPVATAAVSDPDVSACTSPLKHIYTTNRSRYIAMSLFASEAESDPLCDGDDDEDEID